MPAPTQDTVTLHCRWRNNGLNLRAQNSFVFNKTNALVFDTIGRDVIQAFEATALSNYRALVSNQWFIETYVVSQTATALTLHEEGRDNTQTAGSQTGDPLPAQVAGIITLRTDTPGRRGRGRIYLPPPGESSSGPPGVITGGYLTQTNNFMTAMKAMATHGNINFARYEFSVFSKADQQYRVVTDWVTRNIWATQRGRTR